MGNGASAPLAFATVQSSGVFCAGRDGKRCASDIRKGNCPETNRRAGAVLLFAHALLLGERAERAGPDAVALFGVMEDVRNTCLAQIGLTGRIGYD